MSTPRLATGRGIVLLGATSSMARATAFEFARNGYNVIVGARDAEENEAIAADLRIRFGVETAALTFKADDFASHPKFFEKCRSLMGDALEGLVVCFGWMPEQVAAQSDFAKARTTIDVNLTGAVSVCELFAAHFESRRKGFIGVVSSVAGDRGRQSNYLYGSAKAGLSVYLQGLRNRLFHANVAVTTIKPGFVDTKMSFGLPGLFLVASPEKAGRDIYRAIRKRKHTVYTPWFWRYILLIIIHVPDLVFKRLKM